METKQQLADTIAQIRRSMIEALGEAKALIDQKIAIAQSCASDEEFFAQQAVVDALSKEQDEVAARFQRLKAEYDRIEARLRKLEEEPSAS